MRAWADRQQYKSSSPAVTVSRPHAEPAVPARRGRVQERGTAARIRAGGPNAVPARRTRTRPILRVRTGGPQAGAWAQALQLALTLQGRRTQAKPRLADAPNSGRALPNQARPGLPAARRCPGRRQPRGLPTFTRTHTSRLLSTGLSLALQNLEDSQPQPWCKVLPRVASRAAGHMPLCCGNHEGYSPPATSPLPSP